ncbi:amino acid--tRNA ligase-related protein [Streptacidiphilus pinicola]|nr:amino acid--tRNA ligase-related protein [Streptacidiphilus pinicola]
MAPPSIAKYVMDSATNRYHEAATWSKGKNLKNSQADRDHSPQGTLLTQLTGRIVAVRRMKHSTFFDVRNSQQEHQCLAGTSEYDGFGVGVADIVKLHGRPSRSRTGDAVLEVDSLVCLSKPSGQESLTDDFRAGALRRTGRSVRQDRAREILVDSGLRERLRVRIRVMRSIRQSLLELGFDEIDIPVIVTSPFAGTANLFRLNSADLASVDLYLRGSLESHLKQLIVAGFESAYCMGASFRNESAELHEFLMVEGMSSRFDQSQLIDMVEQVIRGAALSVRGFPAVANNRVEALATPWRRDTFSAITGASANEGASVKRAYDALRGPISDGFRLPVFVDKFPAVLSPLAQRDESLAGNAMRGYMFFSGLRICEIVQEQADAEEQRAVFEAQKLSIAGDSGAKKDSWAYDSELLEALKLGCPPLSGFGIHINRLVAALTDVRRVSDVVPFPLASGLMAR